MNTMIGVVALLAAMTAGTTLAKDRPRRLPKGVEALRLSDGSHEVEVKVSSPLPTGDQIQRGLDWRRLHGSSVRKAAT
jgi:hypothetical protein